MDDQRIAPSCYTESVLIRNLHKVQEYVRIEQYYVTRDEEIPHFLAWARRQKVLGYDTETSGLSPFTSEIATIQFGNPLCAEPRAYCICVRSVSREALQPVLDLLADRRIYKLGQNIKFEGLFALHHLNQRLRNVIDTQLTELVLRAGLFPGGEGGGADYGQKDRKAYGLCSMEQLCLRHLGVQIDKDRELRTSFYSTPPGQLTRRQITYANGDVIYPFYVFEAQKLLIEARQLRSVLRVEYEFLPCLVESELRGIPIDAESWTVLWQEACARQADAERQLDTLFLSIQPHLFDDMPGATHVRPLYVGGAGSRSKPKPLNWGSADHVRWAVRQFCEKTEWPIKVLTTKHQVFKAKLALGRAWMEKKGLTERDVCADASDPDTAQGKQELPDFLLPEDAFCILTDADKKTLKLRKIRGQLPERLVSLLLAYAEEKALVSTFGVDFLKRVGPDGRIHTEFHQALASTGRLTSEPNLQNIPKLPEYRHCFRASPGYQFVIADYSQIEPRISAQVSQDRMYLSNYRDAKPDIYTRIGEQLFQKKIDKHTEEGAFLRQLAKVIVLALAYRAGPGKLRDQLTLALEVNITFQQAQEWHAGYLRECHGIQEFQDLCNLLADPTTGQKIWDDMIGDLATYVTSPCGRHRFFPPWAKNTFTESANHPIQACSATITKAAAVKIQQYIDEKEIDACGVNYVHDEIVYEVREDQALEFALVVKRCMEDAGQFYLPDVPCVAEFPEGSNGVVPYWTKKLEVA